MAEIAKETVLTGYSVYIGTLQDILARVQSFHFFIDKDSERPYQVIMKMIVPINSSVWYKAARVKKIFTLVTSLHNDLYSVYNLHFMKSLT